jgi:hypothetical protein
MSNGHQGLPRSERWGCLAGLLIGGSAFLFLLGLDALGDCAPDPSCRKGFLMMVLLPSSIVTALTFLTLRWLIRWIDRRGS